MPNSTNSTETPVCCNTIFISDLYAFHDHWISAMAFTFCLCSMEKEGSFVDAMYLLAGGMFI